MYILVFFVKINPYSLGSVSCGRECQLKSIVICEMNKNAKKKIRLNIVVNICSGFVYFCSLYFNIFFCLLNIREEKTGKMPRCLLITPIIHEKFQYFNINSIYIYFII